MIVILCQLKRLLYMYEHFGDWTDPRMAHTITWIQVRAYDSASSLTTSYTSTSISKRNTYMYMYTFHHTSGLARIMPETTVYTYTNPQLVKHQYHMTTRYHILERLTYTVLSYLLWKHVYSPQAIMSGTSCYMYFKRQKNANRLNPIISCCKQLTHEI